MERQVGVYWRISRERRLSYHILVLEIIGWLVAVAIGGTEWQKGCLLLPRFLAYIGVLPPLIVAILTRVFHPQNAHAKGLAFFQQMVIRIKNIPGSGRQMSDGRTDREISDDRTA